MTFSPAAGPDCGRIAAAYRRIHELGKEPFDGSRFRALYQHFFACELSEDALDHQLVAYACADAVTLADYVRYVEYYLLRHARRHSRPQRVD